MTLVSSLLQTYTNLEQERTVTLYKILASLAVSDVSSSAKNKSRYQLLHESINKIKITAKSSWEKGCINGERKCVRNCSMSHSLSHDVNIFTLSVSEGVRTINYDWIERRFKVGKTSTKTIISFIEGLTLEVEKFYEAWSKVLRSNVTITDDKIIMNAWKDILSASNSKMGAYRQFSVSLLKDISTSFNVLLNQIRSTKVTMDNNEKNSLKKLAAKEAEVNKCEAALQRARKEDQAAAQAYEKMTQTHKGKECKAL